jgi:hypothetical protein
MVLVPQVLNQSVHPVQFVKDGEEWNVDGEEDHCVHGFFLSGFSTKMDDTDETSWQSGNVCIPELKVPFSVPHQ